MSYDIFKDWTNVYGTSSKGAYDIFSLEALFQKHDVAKLVVCRMYNFSDLEISDKLNLEHLSKEECGMRRKGMKYNVLGLIQLTLYLYYYLNDIKGHEIHFLTKNKQKQ